jgi:elongation factor P
MKIDGVQIRVGNVLEHNGKLWVVTKTQHVKPGKGGAFNQVEMKAVKEGTKLNERFRSDDKVERVRLDQVEYQYLYTEDEKVILMHPETYEQIELDLDLLGDSAVYLQDGMMVTVEFHESEALSVALPEKVTLEVSETEPVVKGQTAASSNKPAILENGVRVMVPPFINTGDKVVVMTADSSYLERAK